MEQFTTEEDPTKVKMTYGAMDISDVPIVMIEPHNHTYTRMFIWVSIIFIIMLLFCIIHKKKDAAETNEYTKNMRAILLPKSDIYIKKHNYAKELPIRQYKKYGGAVHSSDKYTAAIEIIIPRKQPDIKDLTCIYNFYINDNNGQLNMLYGQWEYINNVGYKIKLSLQRPLLATQLLLNANIDTLLNKGYQDKIKQFNIYTYDVENVVIQKYSVYIDYNTGETSLGLLNGGYLSILL